MQTNMPTKLTPDEETLFQTWIKNNKISDVDHPESFYDYRGYWKDIASKGEDSRKQYSDGLHFPDTYKQRGHPTFSIESKYSEGPHDGGRWIGENFVPPGADLLVNSRNKPNLSTDLFKSLFAKFKK